MSRLEQSHDDGFELLHRGFDRATARAEIVEQWYRLGDHIALLRFAGPALAELLTPAIRHLQVDPVSTSDLTVDLWDSSSTGVALSPLLGLVVDLAHREPFSTLSARQEINLLNNQRVSTTFELGSGVLTMFDRHRQHAQYWVSDPSQIPYYERGAPFRTLFNWWLSQHGMHCAHAAAVGTDTGAVLLTGKGGSGKSTAALSCVGSELRYLSDDYCVFTVEAEPRVFSLYNTGKMNGAIDLERQPRFKPWVVNPNMEGREKLLMFVHQHSPNSLLASAPLRAVVLPQVTDQPLPTLRSISAVAALKALAPTTMFQLPGASQNAFASMARLVKSLPCYVLESGSDVAAIPHVLGDLLSELEGRSDRSEPSTV